MDKRIDEMEEHRRCTFNDGEHHKTITFSNNQVHAPEEKDVEQQHRSMFTLDNN